MKLKVQLLDDNGEAGEPIVFRVIGLDIVGTERKYKVSIPKEGVPSYEQTATIAHFALLRLGIIDKGTTFEQFLGRLAELDAAEEGADPLVPSSAPSAESPQPPA